MQFPYLSFEQYAQMFSRRPPAIERELIKSLKDAWAEIGARYAPSKEGKTRRPSLARIKWSELSTEHPPVVFPKGHPRAGEQRVNGKGELLWEMSELERAEDMTYQVPQYEPAHPADSYMLGGTLRGGPVSRWASIPHLWIKVQREKTTPRNVFIRTAGVVEQAHSALPPVELRRFRNYTCNSGTQISGQRGRGEVFSGHEGQRGNKADKLVMLAGEIKKLELELELAHMNKEPRKVKRVLACRIHAKKRDLEEMEFYHRNGGVMGRLHNFENSVARKPKSTRGKAAAERIKQEGRKDYR